MKRGEVRAVRSRMTGRESDIVIIGNDAFGESAATGWVIAPLDNRRLPRPARHRPLRPLL
jgi:hypothetical protein